MVCNWMKRLQPPPPPHPKFRADSSSFGIKIPSCLKNHTYNRTWLYRTRDITNACSLNTEPPLYRTDFCFSWVFDQRGSPSLSLLFVELSKWNFVQGYWRPQSIRKVSCECHDFINILLTLLPTGGGGAFLSHTTIVLAATLKALKL